MRILFYDVATSTPMGLVVVDGEANKLSAAGAGRDIATTWSASGRTAQQFAQRYESWSNGYMYSQLEPTGEEVTTAFTIDDEGTVLELIRSDAAGVAVRENGDWQPLDLETENPTVEDQEWLDVTEEAIAFWDEVSGTEEAVKRDKVLEYALEPE